MFALICLLAYPTKLPVKIAVVVFVVSGYIVNVPHASHKKEKAKKRRWFNTTYWTDAEFRAAEAERKQLWYQAKKDAKMKLKGQAA